MAPPPRPSPQSGAEVLALDASLAADDRTWSPLAAVPPLAPVSFDSGTTISDSDPFRSELDAVRTSYCHHGDGRRLTGCTPAACVNQPVRWAIRRRRRPLRCEPTGGWAFLQLPLRGRPVRIDVGAGFAATASLPTPWHSTARRALAVALIDVFVTIAPGSFVLGGARRSRRQRVCHAVRAA